MKICKGILIDAQTFPCHLYKGQLTHHYLLHIINKTCRPSKNNIFITTNAARNIFAKHHLWEKKDITTECQIPGNRLRYLVQKYWKPKNPGPFTVLMLISLTISKNIMFVAVKVVTKWYKWILSAITNCIIAVAVNDVTYTVGWHLMHGHHSDTRAHVHGNQDKCPLTCNHRYDDIANSNRTLTR